MSYHTKDFNVQVTLSISMGGQYSMARKVLGRYINGFAIATAANGYYTYVWGEMRAEDALQTLEELGSWCIISKGRFAGISNPPITLRSDEFDPRPDMHSISCLFGVGDEDAEQ